MTHRFTSAIERATAATIANVPTCKPLMVAAHATLADAVEALNATGRGACVVVDEDSRAVGMFTERDVLRLIDSGTNDWQQRSVAIAMSPTNVRLTSDMTVGAALGRMNEGPFRRLPIVDADGTPRGIVSVWDLMSYVAEHFPQRFFNLPPRPDLEMRNLWGG